MQGVVITLMNITQRRLAEESQSLLTSVVESIEDMAIVSETLNGIILNWSKGAEKIFGYTAAEVQGQSISMLVPAGLQLIYDMPADADQSEKITHVETMLLHKEGRKIPVSINIIPIKDTIGTVVGISKVIRDMSCYYENVAENWYIEKLNRRIMEASVVGINLTDIQGRLVFINRQGKKLLGLTEEGEVSPWNGTITWEAMDAQGRLIPEEELPFNRIMLTQRALYGEHISIKKPDGSRTSFLLNGVEKAISPRL